MSEGGGKSAKKKMNVNKSVSERRSTDRPRSSRISKNLNTIGAHQHHFVIVSGPLFKLFEGDDLLS